MFYSSKYLFFQCLHPAAEMRSSPGMTLLGGKRGLTHYAVSSMNFFLWWWLLFWPDVSGQFPLSGIIERLVAISSSSVA